MDIHNEKAVLLISAPFLVIGLAVVATASAWADRGCGAGMIAGAAAALGSPLLGVRRLGWATAAAAAAWVLARAFT